MEAIPQRILLAVDGSKESELAAQTAVAFAGRLGSELHVVYVYPIMEVYAPFDAEFSPAERAEMVSEETRLRSGEMLRKEVSRIEDAGGKVTESHLRVGRPDEEIVRLAEEIEAGLIVLGSRGFGMLRRALMGSVSDSVVRHAHSPVLVVREDRRRRR